MIIEIDYKCGIAPWQQIADAVAVRIMSDTLAVGQLLPSVKELALQLQVNPNTVQRAYWSLEEVGLVATRAGGYAVAEAGRIPAAIRSDIISRALRRVVSQARQLSVPANALAGLFQELMRAHYDSDT